MTQDELITLRTKILGDITPLVVDAVENTPDRFDILLRIIQAGGAKADVYNKAYVTAQGIEDTQARLDALMALVDEIDFEVQAQSGNQSQPSEYIDNGNDQPVTDDVTQN